MVVEYNVSRETWRGDYNMASRSRLQGIYDKALRQAGYNLTGKERISTLKIRWKEYRQSYYERTGEKAPTVYQQAKQYEQSTAPVIDFGRDYLIEFTNRIDTIYRDTLAYIDSNKEGTHESGKLASIASHKIDQLAHDYQAIMDELIVYVDSGVPLEVIAQAIADNVELDYTIAVALQPPSDVIFLFEETLEQLKGIWTQINTRLEDLQAQAEDEYYGR